MFYQLAANSCGQVCSRQTEKTVSYVVVERLQFQDLRPLLGKVAESLYTDLNLNLLCCLTVVMAIRNS